jgi:hypothetical protein
MNRREIIAGLGSASVWPLAAQAQQSDRIRRIGVLSPLATDDPLARAKLRLSCRVCRNWAGATATCGSITGGLGQCRQHSQIRGELAMLAPDRATP